MLFVCVSCVYVVMCVWYVCVNCFLHTNKDMCVMYSVCVLYICGDVYVVCMCELLLAHWLTQTFNMTSALLGLALRQLFGPLLLCREPPHCSEFRAQFAHRHLLVFIIGSQPSPGIAAVSHRLFWGLVLGFGETFMNLLLWGSIYFTDC